MSYVMQGAQRLGRGISFGAVARTDGGLSEGTLEEAESNKTLIFGAMVLVAAAGGFYLYKRR